jgi:hypothetical protein
MMWIHVQDEHKTQHENVIVSRQETGMIAEALTGLAALQNSNSASETPVRLNWRLHYLLVGGVGICSLPSLVRLLIWASRTVWLRVSLPLKTVTHSRSYSPCSFAPALPTFPHGRT